MDDNNANAINLVEDEENNKKNEEPISKTKIVFGFFGFFLIGFIIAFIVFFFLLGTSNNNEITDNKSIPNDKVNNNDKEKDKENEHEKEKEIEEEEEYSTDDNTGLTEIGEITCVYEINNNSEDTNILGSGFKKYFNFDIIVDGKKVDY